MANGHTKHGKWSQPGVPHIGWTCVGVEDLEQPSELCAMCESTQIRYVHTMEHPDYPETLCVGCVCAENMEQDYLRPRLREQNLRSKSRRRKTWIKRNWRTSAKGNLYLNTEGYNLTEVTLDEVRRLGEDDADFRRSIVTSRETPNTIVDASIRELERLRTVTGDNRLKIIASALNYHHCQQIVEAYRARGRRADYVHSREGSVANQRVMQRLESHQLDVIVQVRKLGEGFDHRFLSVAAVFSIFSNLSPFVQFVGRIMRVIQQNAPDHVLNQGVVVFHAGGNIARQWADFQNYSEADREYFDQLLPLEGIDPDDPRPEREIEPIPPAASGVEVRAQSDVRLEEIPLLQDDAAVAAIRLLHERGYTSDDINAAFETLQPVPATMARQRQAKRLGLDMRVRTEAAQILKQRGINAEGQELDRQRLGRTNLIVMKAALDRQVNATVGRSTKQRHDFSRAELDQIDQAFPTIIANAIVEVLNGTD